jgi:hypothetical protein
MATRQLAAVVADQSTRTAGTAAPEAVLVESVRPADQVHQARAIMAATGKP